MSRTDVERFYEHWGECQACRGGPYEQPFNPCEVGLELIWEAGEDLPEEWHGPLRDLHHREIVRKEAEATFRFYAGEEEP